MSTVLSGTGRADRTREDLEQHMPRPEVVAADMNMRPLTAMSLKRPLKLVRSRMQELLQIPDKWSCSVVSMKGQREHTRLSMGGPHLDEVFPEFHQVLPDGRIDLNRYDSVANVGVQPALHWHNWPIIVWVHERPWCHYKLGIGAGGDTFSPPPIVSTSVFSGPAMYEMNHESGAHFIEPIGGPTYSTAVVGTPWGQKRISFGSAYEQDSDFRRGTVAEKQEMLDEYVAMYRREEQSRVEDLILTER